MYSVSVKNRMFISHSFNNSENYGMTLIFNVTFYGNTLDNNNMLIDIDIASDKIQKIVNKYNYKNLDIHEDFKNEVTTIEHISYRVCIQLKGFILNKKYININKIKVTINESDIAYAEYELSINHNLNYYLFDLDNTLHHNNIILNTIINNIHSVFYNKYGIKEKESEELYNTYGDSIYGLIKTKKLESTEINELYNEIYDINFNSFDKNIFLKNYLANLNGHKWIISNSPKFYVTNILKKLDIFELFENIICPSMDNHFTNKSNETYFKNVINLIGENNKIYFFDDNGKYVEKAAKVGILSYKIHSYHNLEICITKSLDIIDNNFHIKKIYFLENLKNIVIESHNCNIFKRFTNYLKNITSSEINIIEIGCGLSPISDLILPYLIKIFGEKIINYYAYDNDKDIIHYMKVNNKWNNCPSLNFHLLNEDIINILKNEKNFHIICGSTILDMIDYKTIFDHFKNTSPDAILYFIANYSGNTKINGINSKLTDIYNHAMVMKKQFTSNYSYDIINYLTKYTTISWDNSDWNINNSYLLPVIKNYILSHSILELDIEHINKNLIVNSIYISNIDFVAIFNKKNDFINTSLQITKPYILTVLHEKLKPIANNEILIKTIYSGISTGTELKMFRGDIEKNVKLDTNLSIGENEYPMKYGYCSVGKIIQIGEDITNFNVGTKVFTFYHHSKYVITTTDNIIIIPQDISYEDAIFFPNMETAVSLIQDMMINAGENVAIYGQGCVGLLVNMILSLNTLINVYAYEILDKRIDLAKKINKNSYLNSVNIDHDVILEITGSTEVLSQILKNNTYAQRIIIGSWYENSPCEFLLNTNFHRNHLNIKTSQVSNISGCLLDRWDKKRRIKYVWELIQKLTPSKKIPITFENINNAQDIFNKLNNKGDYIQIVFKYPE